ncbi:Uncharacterised protein [Budvicia aquatica]|uniref:Uncharacterized protein n=1 Tax=Budvicia aquatica TaxID=82979 RepID=A0A484ZF02_9GAMM|nr:Uncharacterised protein [Budvicia aquatica]
MFTTQEGQDSNLMPFFIPVRGDQWIDISTQELF